MPAHYTILCDGKLVASYWHFISCICVHNINILKLWKSLLPNLTELKCKINLGAQKNVNV